MSMSFWSFHFPLQGAMTLQMNARIQEKSIPETVMKPNENNQQETMEDEG